MARTSQDLERPMPVRACSLKQTSLHGHPAATIAWSRGEFLPNLRAMGAKWLKRVCRVQRTELPELKSLQYLMPLKIRASADGKHWTETESSRVGLSSPR